MSGGNYQLDNLCALVDRNRLQISGSTEDVMKQDSQEERWQPSDGTCSPFRATTSGPSTPR